MNPLVQSILLSDQTTGADSSAVTIDQSLRFRGTQLYTIPLAAAYRKHRDIIFLGKKIAELDRESIVLLSIETGHHIVNVRNLNDWCFNLNGSSFVLRFRHSCKRSISLVSRSCNSGRRNNYTFCQWRSSREIQLLALLVFGTALVTTNLLLVLK